MTVLSYTHHQFGPVVEFVATVQDVLDVAKVNPVQVDPVTGEIKHVQRKRQKPHSRNITKAVADSGGFDGKSNPWIQPVVFNLKGVSPASLLKVKDVNQALKKIGSADSAELLDAQQRTSGAREYLEALMDSAEASDDPQILLAINNVLKTPVRVQCFADLSEADESMVFLMLNDKNFSKPVSKDVCLLNYANVYGAGDTKMPEKLRLEARAAYIIQQFIHQSESLRKRVKGLNGENGPSYATLVNLFKDLYFPVHQVEDDEVIQYMATAMRAVYKKWPALSDRWEQLSHNNAMEIAFVVMSLMVSLVGDFTEGAELSQAKANKFAATIMPILDGWLEQMGNPHIETKFGGSAADYASGAAKGKLRKFVKDVVMTAWHKEQKPATV